MIGVTSGVVVPGSFWRHQSLGEAVTGNSDIWEKLSRSKFGEFCKLAGEEFASCLSSPMVECPSRNRTVFFETEDVGE